MSKAKKADSKKKEKTRGRRLPMPTHRDGIFYISYHSERRVRVILYDNHGCKIPQAETCYTRKNGESEEDGLNHALRRAIEKVDAMTDAMDPERNSGDKYFSDRWYGLKSGQRSQCANGLTTDDPDKIPSIKYFQNNVLHRLDQYGKSITQTQILDIREELLMLTLTRVTYTKFEVKTDEVIEIPNFFSVLKVKLSARYSKLSDKNAALLEYIQKKVLEDDRLRTLLERHLRAVGTPTAVENFMKRLAEGKELVRHLSSQKEDSSASLRMIGILRVMSGNVPVAKRTVNTHLFAINRILQGLALSQEDSFPIVIFPIYEDALPYQEEKPKTLPQSLRLTFARRMMNQAANSNIAVAALIMLTVGTRTEETCALRFSQVLDRGNYGVYTVTATNRAGVIAQSGKNQYFARTIILMKIVMVALGMRRAYLRSKGYTNAQIDTFYIACDPENVKRPIYPAKFSESVIEALLDCGCTNDILNDAERAQLAYFPEMDPVAYLLRHDAISIMCNYDGMDPLLVDAMVGHDLPDNSPDWFAFLRDEDKWESIACQMERFVYIPECSMNPAYHPIDVEELDGRFELSTQEIALNVRKGERYQVVYEVNRGSEYVQADIPSASEAEFGSSASSSNQLGTMVLPLNSAKDYRRAEAQANSPSKEQTKDKGVVLSD